MLRVDENNNKRHSTSNMHYFLKDSKIRATINTTRNDELLIPGSKKMMARNSQADDSYYNIEKEILESQEP
jgi:hypothetical protein